MNVLYCAYRGWALNVLHDIRDLLVPNGHDCRVAYSPEDLVSLNESFNPDVIIIVGWSWKVPEEIVRSKVVVGMHPSNLPEYAGGSPIQHQILDGRTESVATLFKLNEKFDRGDIIDKEPFSLVGHLDDVFESLEDATFKLLKRFLDTFPNFVAVPQTNCGVIRKRLKPEDSKLPAPPIKCSELWNAIRAREDPYPNAYFEDETGRLVIRWAEFIPAGQETKS